MALRFNQFCLFKHFLATRQSPLLT
uniref:Uncharacterized protein n=1 Tax=Arundo donax TaxID=35708 RepID=A0A0A9EFQ4_ARUDO